MNVDGANFPENDQKPNGSDYMESIAYSEMTKNPGVLTYS